MGAVNLCLDDGSELVQIAATPQMLQDSPGFVPLVNTFKQMKGRYPPMDNIVMAFCPSCDNTFLWVDNGPPRVGIIPQDGD